MVARLSLDSPVEQFLARSSPTSVRVAIWLVLSLFLASIIGSALFKIEIYATAQGRVQPVGRSKSIQAPEQARIVSVTVREGEHVSMGQVLAILDPASSVFDQQAASLERFALMAERTRRLTEDKVFDKKTKALRLDFPPDLPKEDRDREALVYQNDLAHVRLQDAVYDARILSDVVKQRELSSKLQERDQARAILNWKLTNRRALFRDGLRSGTELSDTEIELNHASSDLVEARQALAEAYSDQVEMTAERASARAKFRKDNSDQLQLVENKLNQTEMQLAKHTHRTLNLTIKSPVNGTVQGLTASGQGEVSSPGQTLMTVVPDDGGIQIEALVSDQDVGFIAPGQEVVLKIRAYPYTRYGVVRGLVAKVGRDSIGARDAVQGEESAIDPAGKANPQGGPLPHTNDLVFPVIIALKSSSIQIDGVRTPIRSGMAVQVEIETAKRTVLEYILAPVAEAFAESGHER